MALLDDGSLVFTIHGANTFPYQVGIAKIDVDGEIVWRRLDHSHHWITVGADQRIYTPYAELREDLDRVGETPIKLECREGVVYDEGIRVITPDGRLEREFSILREFAETGYAGLFSGLPNGCDPVHINSVELVTPAVAEKLRKAETGDLLVSIRNINTIAILDQQSGKPKYVVSGLTAAQHSPVFLPDATVVVFDNMGGTLSLGGTRIARIDLETREASTIFPRPGEVNLIPFFSEDGGHVSVSPDGNRVLTSLKAQGRIVELDVKTGEPLWILEKTFDNAPYFEKRGITVENSRGRFRAYGAYYINNLNFLGE